MLEFDQEYRWKIGYNDTQGNSNFSDELSFTVIDSYLPDVIIPASQTSSVPEYNETVQVSITVYEPIDASGIDTIWLNYTNDNWISFSVVNITETGSFTFTDVELEYNQDYYWKMAYNDSEGNTGYSEIISFLVSDSYAPDVTTEATQTTSTPQYNGSIQVSIIVNETIDASGVAVVWLNYSNNNWLTHTVTDITQEQQYTFTESMLEYNQFYQWIIGFNDSAGNVGSTSEFNFTVTDYYAPDVRLILIRWGYDTV